MKIDELGKYQTIIDFGDLFTKSVTDIYYKEGEIGTASIKAKLVKKRTPIDLTDCRVIITIVNETGEHMVDWVTIVDGKEGIVEINFEQVMLNAGISFFELTVVDNNTYNTKKSPKIAYRVIDSLSEDAIIESEKYPILVNLIKTVDELHVATNALADKTFELNADVRKLDTEVRQLNEDMLLAEGIRDDNEETRKANEIVRQSNEDARILNMEQFRRDFDTFKTDVNNSNTQFKDNVNTTVTTFKSEVNTQLETFDTNMQNFQTTITETVDALPRIDNETLSDVNTFSSEKISQELAKKSEFDGSYNSLTDVPATYLAEKIIHSDGESSEEKIATLTFLVEILVNRVQVLEELVLPPESETPEE